MPLKTQRDEQPQLNLTPMIDIVFLLIIFFMVGTRFSELNEAEKEIELNVPEVAGADALTPAPQKRKINVMRDGTILLDDQPVTLAELQQILTVAKQEYDQLGVIVRGDANSLYQHVAKVLDACRAAKITDLGISVRPQE